MAMFYALKSEWLKLIYKRATHIILALILVFQTFLANIGASQILSVGLDATPETTPDLLEAIPPIEFLGFDVTLFGVFVMIILGAIVGAQEYRRSALRTSLLAVSDRKIFLLSKLLTWLGLCLMFSFLSIFLTINMTHSVLGNQGLPLFVLNSRVWLYMVYASLAWTLLGLLAYLMALSCKTAVAPLLFLLPQVYNLGAFLATHFSWAHFLPVSLGQGLIATSPDALTDHVGRDLVVLLLWNALFLILAVWHLMSSDVGGGE